MNKPFLENMLQTKTTSKIFTIYPGNLIFRGYKPIFPKTKTLIFHGLGVQGYSSQISPSPQIKGSS